MVGIFDIGTRAIRLLVGPKRVPTEEWRRDTFCNLGQILNLGDDFDESTQMIDLAASHKFEDLCEFMATLKGIMLDHGVKEEDISAIGTAIFRWLNNRDQVLEEIERETGIRVTVLSAADEARLTLHAIGHTYRFRLKEDAPELGKDDAILLLDQGGGSMEVSFLTMGNEQKVFTHTFDGLGTIALRRLFFQDIDVEDPEWISKQIQKIQHYIAEKINDWEGTSELAGKKLHAYGMGAVITNYVSGSNYTIHNQRIEADKLLQDASEAVGIILQKQDELIRLYQVLNERTQPELFETERLLDRTYGPPVYVRVLRKFNLDHLRICGYGLRYGAYVWQNYIGRSLTELNPHSISQFA
ncbi:MAG: hypothetical protein D6820_06175 [Lentisphaerae bacterium]|nr:MAG: hypothetical protein D6820_06175 [Lentisphaerota bacterium]